MFEGLFGDLNKERKNIPKFFQLTKQEDRFFKLVIKDNEGKSIGFANTNEDAILLIKTIYQKKNIKFDLQKEGDKLIPIVIL